MKKVCSTTAQRLIDSLLTRLATTSNLVASFYIMHPTQFPTSIPASKDYGADSIAALASHFGGLEVASDGVTQTCAPPPPIDGDALLREWRAALAKIVTLKGHMQRNGTLPKTGAACMIKFWSTFIQQNQTAYPQVHVKGVVGTAATA
jgi:hypothetical protein